MIKPFNRQSIIIIFYIFLLPVEPELTAVVLRLSTELDVLGRSRRTADQELEYLYQVDILFSDHFQDLLPVLLDRLHRVLLA